MRPNFFLIGAQRSGTTTLCDVLARHPSVFVSEPKEPGFFARPAGDLEQYERLFAGAREAAIGEGSTRYSQASVYPGTAERIASYRADARIIYIVRDPIERLRSAWVQYRSEARHAMSRDVNRAILESPELIDASRYLLQLAQYEDHFPSSQIHVMFFEEFCADPRSAISETLAFLDLPPAPIAEGVVVQNSSRGKAADRVPLRVARRAGFDRRVHSFLPRRDSPPRRWGRAFLKQPLTKPQLSARSLGHLRAELHDESARLLNRFGRSRRMWPATFGPEDGVDDAG